MQIRKEDSEDLLEDSDEEEEEEQKGISDAIKKKKL